MTEMTRTMDGDGRAGQAGDQGFCEGYGALSVVVDWLVCQLAGCV